MSSHGPEAQARFDAYFDEALDHFARAEARAGGALTRRFRIAGKTIDLRFAAEALVSPLSQALAHLEVVEPGPADFSFLIFDETAGVGSPRPRWKAPEISRQGEVDSLIDDDRYLHVEWPRLRVIAAKRSSRSAIVWFPSEAEAESERAGPLVPLINWWASGVGYGRAHSAAVGRPDGGVLIAGPPGAGKSHTAMACLRSDLFYASDDQCLIRLNGSPAAASIYSTGKLYLSDLHRFPFLESRKREATWTPEGKAIFFLNAMAPEGLSSGFPLKAILLPKPSGQRDTRIVPHTAPKALLELVPETVLRWPMVGRRHLASLAAFTHSLPCFVLETGTDLPQIPQVIAALLDSLPEVSPLKS